MQRRYLHVFLCFLVMAQPVTSAVASASMVGSSLAAATSMGGHDMSGMEMPGVDAPGMEMPDCHSAEPAVPDCCAEMDGVSCGMDCGTVSPALGQAALAEALAGHGAFEGHPIYAAALRSPNTFLKPPRTS